MQINKLVDLLAIIIFITAMILVPWEQLQGYEFLDRQVYIEYFLYGKNVLEYREFNGILDYLTYEALWHKVIAALVDDAGIPIDHIFLAISVLSLATSSFFLIRRHNPLSLLLLINPLLVDLAFSQLRIALAFSLLVIGYLIRKRTLFITLVLIAMFIHTATIIFAGIIIAVLLVKRYFSEKGANKVLIFSFLCVVGLCISLVISPLRETILSTVGDRRLDYDDHASSFLYSSFWIGMLVLCAFQNKSFLQDEVNCYSIIILSLVFFNVITSGYSTRFIAVSLPMLMSTMLSLSPRTQRPVAILVYASYVLIQWVYWLLFGTSA